MESKKNLVFLGMMGSGKTTIGKLISKKLKLNFFDIDSLIEKKMGISISSIFNKKGEKFFREIEEEITLDILKKKNNVISLGGGGFLNNNIRKEIISNHISIWLDWNVKTLVNRVNKSSRRPLAFNTSKGELVNLIKKRSNIYSKAMYKVNCNNLSKIEVLNETLKIYENNQIKN